MISILTAGDKHFFRHIETIKRQTGLKLNLWGINPLEVTHFKSGFLGVPPDFEEKRVYSHGAMKQLRYQYLRLKAMLESLGISIAHFGTHWLASTTGVSPRKRIIITFLTTGDGTKSKLMTRLLLMTGAPDTNTTWRIGDGTAAFYNYIYYTVAGFTEHDTFRSNQIREGDLTRAEALKMVEDENRPRYPNIKWYLDAVGIEFEPAIKAVNAIPKLY